MLSDPTFISTFGQLGMYENITEECWEIYMW